MISIKGLRKNFQSGDQVVAALQGIDLEVERGEFFVLLGPSGSGKTTLLRSVAGLEKPDGGEISLNGKTVFSSSRRISEPPEAREIGMVTSLSSSTLFKITLCPDGSVISAMALFCVRTLQFIKRL